MIICIHAVNSGMVKIAIGDWQPIPLIVVSDKCFWKWIGLYEVLAISLHEIASKLWNHIIKPESLKLHVRINYLHTKSL